MENNHEHYQSKFKKLVLAQIALVVVATVALLYISSQVNREMKIYAEMQQKNEKLRAEQEQLKADFEKEKKNYESLQDNIKKLYATAITAENEVFELQATAKATGTVSRSNESQYDFKIFINTSESLLEKIEKVVYHFNHPTFPVKEQESVNKADRFSVGYKGWGCLANMEVEIHLADKTVQKMNFNMCKSIGWE